MAIDSKLAYELKEKGFPQTFPLGRSFYVEEERVTVTTPDEDTFRETLDVSKTAVIPTTSDLISEIIAGSEATVAMNVKEGYAIAVIENSTGEGEALDEALAKLFIKRKEAGL